jgi:hypothetical protein
MFFMREKLLIFSPSKCTFLLKRKVSVQAGSSCNMYELLKTKRNLPFCMARAAAHVGFTDVVTSLPCLAMHPDEAGCIDALLDAVDPPLHSCGDRDKKAGV